MIILEMALTIAITMADTSFVSTFEPNDVGYPIDPNPPKVIVPTGCVLNDDNEFICYPADGSGK